MINTPPCLIFAKSDSDQTKIEKSWELFDLIRELPVETEYYHNECPQCGAFEVKADAHHGYWTCHSCGFVVYDTLPIRGDEDLDNSYVQSELWDNPADGDVGGPDGQRGEKDHSRFKYKIINNQYKRESYWREVTSQNKGEGVEVDYMIVHTVETEYKKRGIPVEEATNEMTLQILRDVELNSYYEHSIQITNRINRKATVFPEGELQDKADRMFLDARAIWPNAPDDIKRFGNSKVKRKSFPNYRNFTRMCYRYLGVESQVDHIKKIKTREKVIEHNHIWDWMGAQLGWKNREKGFIPIPPKKRRSKNSKELKKRKHNEEETASRDHTGKVEAETKPRRRVRQRRQQDLRDADRPLAETGGRTDSTQNA
jgi:ribosomal protein S27AE